ncbi:MAG: hypothetical protein KBT58_08230 [Bizionia sp.]|nr:hypothetical protein [Bizionia sp.]
MKAKTTLFTILFFMIVSIGSAQKNKKSLQLINGKVGISKYHSQDELKQLSKGEILNLYIQRIEVIVKILPNIAFATTPNVTMETLGIPETKENMKALQANLDATTNYFDSTVEFQRSILPYSDSNDLISAILFYEEILKSLHTYDDFKSN